MISANGGDGHPNPDFNKSTQEKWGDSAPRFLTAYGSFDTHAVTLRDGKMNTRPQAGQPYESISWAEIRGLVATPAARPKNSAQFVILSTYTECDGRTHKVQRELGQFWGLAVDIDAGNQPLSAVEAAVRDVAAGAAAIIYSSSSASPENRKWRVLIALHSPLAGADYPDTQQALFELLESRGLRCDITLARAGQPIYLPNVPPKRRAKDGRPLFYQLQYIEGRPLDLSPGAIIVEAREALRARRTAEQAKDVARAVAQRDERLAYVEATGDDFEPISHFKANHTVAAMLARYGFKESQRRKHHYSSPLSESGSYSTQDYGDYWVTVSAWAHKHNVGRVSANGNRFGDAFDLFTHFEHGGDRRGAVRAYSQAVRPNRKAVTPDEWRQKSDAFQLCLSSERADLADKLGVAETALTALHCGWSAKGYWTFPVRDGSGNIVGISTRLAEPIRSCDGKVTTQKMVMGSRHGLFYAPEALAAGDGPILLVKGASDTAAAYTMGLTAVGRPSCKGGVNDLAELLRDIPAGRQIIVVGENDEREAERNGKKIIIYPGRNGATLTAKTLAKRLGRQILWTMPPAGAKDTREYLQNDGHDAGGKFFKLLLKAATTVDPPGADTDIELMPDRGPARNLDDWRSEATASKIAAMQKTGYFLDRGAVGTGKTVGTIKALEAAEWPSFLWIMPDHVNCNERAAEIKKMHGIDVAVYPKIDEDNCGNLAAVRKAQANGLVAGAAVCPSCPLKDACEKNGYLALKEKAERSEHRIATISRAAASDSIFREKRFKKSGPIESGEKKTWVRPAPKKIIFDERVGDALAEIISTRLSDVELVEEFLANMEAGKTGAGRRKVKPEHTDFAWRLAAVVAAIKKAADNVAGGGAHLVKLPGTAVAPRMWQAVFADWLDYFGTSRPRSQEEQERFAAAMRLITLAGTGRIKEVWVAGDQTRTKKVVITVVAKRLADLPKNDRGEVTATVLLLDADATVEDLAARSGLKVNDITPAGHIPTVQPVRQVLLDVANAAAASTTAKIITTHLRNSPYRKLGVIGHKRALGEVFREDQGMMQKPHLTARDRERVAMRAGFGTGPDRGSNVWPTVCDELAVIGTPRAPIVRQWLIAHGKIEAASLPDGDWGEVRWEGVTTEGVRKIFTTCGYRNPEWRQAAKAVHRTALMQPGGRARAILESGIPVTLYTSEPTGFPVDESVKALMPAVHEAVEAVMTLLEDQTESANGSISYLEPLALSVPVRSPDVVAYLMFETGIGRRAAQRKIDLAVKADRLERLEGGRLIRLALPASCRLAIEPLQRAPEPFTEPLLRVVGPPVRPAIVVEAFPPRPTNEPVIVAGRLVPKTAARAASIDTRPEYSALPPPPRREIEPAWTSDPSLETANVLGDRPR